jgi:hypothetical protein
MFNRTWQPAQPRVPTVLLADLVPPPARPPPPTRPPPLEVPAASPGSGQSPSADLPILRRRPGDLRRRLEGSPRPRCRDLPLSARHRPLPQACAASPFPSRVFGDQGLLRPAADQILCATRTRASSSSFPDLHIPADQRPRGPPPPRLPCRQPEPSAGARCGLATTWTFSMVDAVPIFFFASFFQTRCRKKVQNARFTQYATVSR